MQLLTTRNLRLSAGVKTKADILRGLPKYPYLISHLEETIILQQIHYFHCDVCSPPSGLHRMLLTMLRMNIGIQVSAWNYHPLFHRRDYSKM